MYCGRKFESEDTKYHSEEQYSKFKRSVREGTHVPDTRKGISRYGSDSYVLSTGDGRPTTDHDQAQHYYYSRPPYACKDCATFVNAFPSMEHLGDRHD